ncbi:MAG: threonine/serine exporter family protein [Pseudoflavonifractor sp.]|nr:threonine/serine exporter family protein [Pseudoflavonifractor sp.]
MEEIITTYLLPVIFAFVASGGFAVIYNIHGGGILICAFGGALGWLAYLASAPILQSEISQSFVAAIVISAYSEWMARVRKCPVTGYLLVAFFPLVPGGGIYYTMEHAINGEISLFLSSFLHTLGIAGALAVGVLLVSSAVRMWGNYHHRRALTRKRENQE